MPSILDGFLPGLINDVVKGAGLTTAVSFQRRTGTYDPVTGVATPSSTNVNIDILPPENFKRYYINGTTILEGDIKISAAAAQFARTTPALNPAEPLATSDQIVIGGRIYQIISVDREMSGDLAVMYHMQCRR